MHRKVEKKINEFKSLECKTLGIGRLEDVFKITADTFKGRFKREINYNEMKEKHE